MRLGSALGRPGVYFLKVVADSLGFLNLLNLSNWLFYRFARKNTILEGFFADKRGLFRNHSGPKRIAPASVQIQILRAQMGSLQCKLPICALNTGIWALQNLQMQRGGETRQMQRREMNQI